MDKLTELPEDGIFREAITSKGVVDKELERAKIVEISRDVQTGLLGVGISEGEVRSGVRVRVGRRVLEFVEKVFNSNYYLNKKFPEITLERIVLNHARLKKLGFPVINTMRIVDTPKGAYERILMTDLTEGERNIVLSSSSDLDDNPPIANLTNCEDVERQLLDIYKKLNDDGVQVCHNDVFFLVINKETGVGKIVLGDISRIVFGDDAGYKPSPLEIEANNYENMESFVGMVNRSILGRQIDFSCIRDFMVTGGNT